MNRQPFLRRAGLCILSCSLLLTGCWDRREINDVAFLLLTGVDEGTKPNAYHVEGQIAIPARMGTSQSGTAKTESSPYITIPSDASNLDHGRMMLERKLSRDLSQSHRRVIVIGDSLARRGIKEILDEWTRSPKNRLRTFLVVSKKLKAQKFIQESYPLESYPAEVLRELIMRKMETPTTLRDFIIKGTMPGGQPVAAAFSLSPKFNLDSIAIFKDYKLVGYVDGLQAVFLNSLLGRKPFGAVKVTLPKIKGDVSIQLTNLKPEWKVQIIDDKPQFHFKVNTEGIIQESTVHLDLTNPAYIEKLNEALAKRVKQEYEALLEKLQKDFKTDSIGLGTMIYQSNPKYWKKVEKNWPNLFVKTKVKWTVKAQIREIGVSGAPLPLPEDEVKK